MTVLSMPVLPDCTRCGGPVSLVIDGDGSAREVCVACGLSLRPMPPKVDRQEIREAVKASRTRRLLGPSCFGRRHHLCKASNCRCLCHEKESPRGAEA